MLGIGYSSSLWVPGFLPYISSSIDGDIIVVEELLASVLIGLDMAVLEEEVALLLMQEGRGVPWVAGGILPVAAVPAGEG